MASDSTELTRRLGYTFHDRALLARALTHRSKSAHHNERLEFLGDSVLNLVVTAYLFDRYPELDEGALTRLRASLVNKPSLATVARGLGLGNFLLLGEGELKSGGFDRDSILADALEAIFGAVYLDTGPDEARRVILSSLDEKLKSLDPRAVPKDPKTRLQEWLQKRSLPTPDYRVIEIGGEAHSQRFMVECHLAGVDQPIRGEGTSRRMAEQDAATRALAQLSKST